MDTVTYLAESVQQELTSQWLMIKVDVTTRQPVADLCDVHAIPVALALNGDGNILGRVLGFIAPDKMTLELAKLRSR